MQGIRGGPVAAWAFPARRAKGTTGEPPARPGPDVLPPSPGQARHRPGLGLRSGIIAPAWRPAGTVARWARPGGRAGKALGGSRGGKQVI